jgi:cation transport ATPase
MKIFKSLVVLTIIFTFIGAKISAQTESSASTTSVVKIKTSAECDMCKTRIEKEVNGMKGVKKAELDLTTKILTVEYNANKTSPDKIRTAISNIGYDADDVKANNKANKNLPACCQKKDSAQ